MSFSFNMGNMGKPEEAAPNFSFGSPAGDAKGINANKPFANPIAQPNAARAPTPGQPTFGTPTGQQPFATQTGQPTFGTPTGQTAFGKIAAKPSAPSFSLGTTLAPATSALSFGATPLPTGFGFSAAKPATTTTTGTGFNLGTTPSTGFSLPAATTVSAFEAPASSNLSYTPATSAPAFGGFSPAIPAPAPTAAYRPPVAAATTSASNFNWGAAPVSTAAATGFSVGAGAVTSAPSFSLGATPAYTAPVSAFSLTTSTPATTSTATAPSLGFSVGGTPAKTTTGFSVGGTTTTTSTTTLSLGLTTTTSSTLTSTALSSALPATSTLTFGQLEEAINKWTIDLEEQGKLYSNQAKQLNAWDRFLISNGEKVLSLNSGIERVKQQQQELDQELDFVLAQQKELEDLITPLEKELEDIPVNDIDRSNTYQLAENIDTQLKQMTEDLKEIIEQLNESNKAQEVSNPITQIGKILNAHMNSLQWIDQNTTKISTHLDQISKMHDLNRKSHEMTSQRAYD